MRAIQILKYGRTPQLCSMDIPTAAQQQYLVRMHYAPLNPSDINFYMGSYGINKKLPAIMGFEGSGVIIGGQDQSLKNRVVSVMASQHNGTYATHIVANRSHLVVWPEGTNSKDVASACVNPMSAIGMKKIAIENGCRSVVLSAANSALCRMLIRMCKTEGINVIGIVRKEEQKQPLLELGASHILVGYDSESTVQMIRKLPEKCCFLDSMGGSEAGNIFNQLPQRSIMVNYGRLTKEKLGGIDPGQLYFRGKTIRGFWLNHYLQSLGTVQMVEMEREIVSNFQKFYMTSVDTTHMLEECSDAMRVSIRPGRNGKVLLDCH